MEEKDSNLEIVTAGYQKPTSSLSIRNIQPSPSLSAAKRQVIASQLRGASKDRGYCNNTAPTRMNQQNDAAE